MSGIFTSLNASSKALQTHSRFVETAGKNIANINNPNYARQRVETGNIGVTLTQQGPQAGPLVALGITQARDRFLDAQILNEASFTSSLETQVFLQRQILANLGETFNRIQDPKFIADVQFDSGGLRGSIDTFFNAFEALTAQPNDPNAKQILFQSAQNLVSSFNRIDDRLTRMSASLDRGIDDEVDKVNRLLEEVTEMNTQIARLEVGSSGKANDLRDQRLAKLEEISRYIAIEVDEPKDGLGQVLLSVRDLNGEKVGLVTPGSASATLLYDPSTGTIRPAGSAEALDLQIGSINAQLEIRNEALPTITGQIDALANALATSINNIYYQAFAAADPLDPSSADIPERAFFQMPLPPPGHGGPVGTVTARTLALYTAPSDPATVSAFIPLNSQNLAATNTTFAGANELAMRISALATQSSGMLGNLSFSDFATRLIVGVGQDIQDSENRLMVQRDVEAILVNRRSEVSGVSMDEELTNMVQYQKAFQASSRVFNILSEMLDTIVNGLR